MDQVPQVLTGLASIGALLALAAAAAAYFRASYAKATITTLSESNTALLEQVGILKSEREADQAKAELRDQRMAALERENETLREVVQGKADIERVIQVLQDQHHSIVQDRDQWRDLWAERMSHQDGALSQIKGMLGNSRTSGRSGTRE